MNAHAREVAAILEVVGEFYQGAAAPGFKPPQAEIIKMTATFLDRDNAARYLIDAMKWHGSDALHANMAFSALALWSMSMNQERRRWVEEIVHNILVHF